MPGKKANNYQETYNNNNNDRVSPSKIYWKKGSNPAVGLTVALIIAGIEIALGYLIFFLFCQ
jgi:hypothetical protein